jgi:two-component system chemotaxis response regulator CheY
MAYPQGRIPRHSAAGIRKTSHREASMRVLVVEDDFTSRKILQKILGPYGDVDIAVNGLEAVQAFTQSLDDNNHYDLICMDIMMPEMDGQTALKNIRTIERERGIVPAQEVKVVMTTALDDPKNVVEAYYKGGATSYVPKPIDKHMLLHLLKNLGVIE